MLDNFLTVQMIGVIFILFITVIILPIDKH